LIAEDEGFVRRGIIANIDWQSIGIGDVFEAEDGLEAYKLALKHKPHIVLSDIRMPKMDGLELAAKLRDFINCQVIFISAYSDKEYLKSAIRINALDYVEKPISIDELIDALKKAVTACRRREMTVVLTPEEADALPVGLELCDKIVQIIEENYSDPELSITFICEKAYTSRSNVCTAFKRETGKTLNEAINDYRVAKACKLLHDTGLSFAEVAERTGFREYNYFSKLFKKRMGLPPSAYRRSINNG